MNVYFKHWEPTQVDAELNDILGVRFYKHAEKKKYRACTLQLIVPKLGMLSFCFTDNHKAYRSYWKTDWNELYDWQLFNRKTT